MAAAKFKRGQVVRDAHGNHYIVRGFAGTRVRIESVATKETFRAWPADLEPSDRVAF